MLTKVKYSPKNLHITKKSLVSKSTDSQSYFPKISPCLSLKKLILSGIGLFLLLNPLIKGVSAKKVSGVILNSNQKYTGFAILDEAFTSYLSNTLANCGYSLIITEDITIKIKSIQIINIPVFENEIFTSILPIKVEKFYLGINLFLENSNKKSKVKNICIETKLEETKNKIQEIVEQITLKKTEKLSKIHEAFQKWKIDEFSFDELKEKISTFETSAKYYQYICDTLFIIIGLWTFLIYSSIKNRLYIKQRRVINHALYKTSKNEDIKLRILKVKDDIKNLKLLKKELKKISKNKKKQFKKIYWLYHFFLKTWTCELSGMVVSKPFHHPSYSKIIELTEIHNALLNNKINNKEDFNYMLEESFIHKKRLLTDIQNLENLLKELYEFSSN